MRGRIYYRWLEGYDMISNYAEKAIQSVLASENSFCKFLSANDTGSTGGHQAGILISKSAIAMMFTQKEIEQFSIPKRLVHIVWQDQLETQSAFTYYHSKKELRITRFGKNFPYLNPEQTGSLFVLTQQGRDDYRGYFLDTEEEIEAFLSAFGKSPTETNCLIEKEYISPEIIQKKAIQEFIEGLDTEFPSSEIMSITARNIEGCVYNHRELILTNPDAKIISWTNMEYTLFRALEHARYGNLISKGFKAVDEFVRIANIVLNRRKSRAGKSFENHLAAIFDANSLSYSSQATTEGNKRPDFLFPSEEDYHNENFPVERLISLAAKTTCKDRWRQILNEANRLRNCPKYLCTLQQGVSKTQLQEMKEEKVILVVPKPYHASYPKEFRGDIWTLSKFVSYVKFMEHDSCL